MNDYSGKSTEELRIYAFAHYIKNADPSENGPAFNHSPLTTNR